MNIKLGTEAFFVKNKELLLGRRKNVHGAGSWALPGGHVEFGEKVLVALKREMQEELGVDIQRAKLVTVTDDFRPKENQHYLHVSFLVEKYLGQITNNEPDRCEEWQYFPLNKLPEDIYPPHAKILKTFFARKLYLK